MMHLTFINQLHGYLQENGIDPKDWEIRSLDAVGSTNDRAKDLLEFYPKIVILSKIQSSGRGRGKNQWYSPEGGIWMSIGLRQSRSVRELSGPVIHRLQEYLQPYVQTEVKEPNDLLINGKKVCGILVETSIQKNKMHNIIIGIGINVNNEIPEDISDIATRLADHCDHPNLYKLASELAGKLILDLGEITHS